MLDFGFTYVCAMIPPCTKNETALASLKRDAFYACATAHNGNKACSSEGFFLKPLLCLCNAECDVDRRSWAEACAACSDDNACHVDLVSLANVWVPDVCKDMNTVAVSCALETDDILKKDWLNRDPNPDICQGVSNSQQCQVSIIGKNEYSKEMNYDYNAPICFSASCGKADAYHLTTMMALSLEKVMEATMPTTGRYHILASWSCDGPAGEGGQTWSKSDFWMENVFVILTIVLAFLLCGALLCLFVQRRREKQRINGLMERLLSSSSTRGSLRHGSLQDT